MNINQNITLDQTPNLKINPYENTILSLFRLQVENYPHKVAVKIGEKNLTYQELNKISDNLASALVLKGLKKDTPVGILLPRSLEFIVSIFGILKAGGAYLPLGPNDGEERLANIIVDCKCPFLLTKSQFLNQTLSPLNTQILEIEIEGGDLIGFDDIPFYPQEIRPENLAYIIYTSGTTGLPKGAMIEHRNLFTYIKNFRPTINYDDRTLHSMNPACDSSIGEIFPTLCNGGTLVLWQENLSSTIREEKITYTTLTPSMAELVDPADCLYLKKLILGGEKLTPEVVKRFPKDVALYNGYGPTEGTVDASITRIYDAEKIHIGDRLPHVELHVVNRLGEICPTGEPGELWIGGGGIGRGYLNRPELNKEKFIPNPFGEGILYKTGDLVCWRSEEHLDFLGRIDRQVKVRGFRVELDGLEKVICSFSGVTGSHIVFKNGNLIAYLTPENINLADLKKFLEKELPSYSIPSKFFNLEKFPINSAGKVDEKSLPEVFIRSLDKTNLPETDLQKKMAEIWRNIIEPKSSEKEFPISLDDNFFDLGGNSLHAIKLISVINETFQMKMSLQFIYQNPFLKDFVESFNQAEKEKTTRVKFRPPLNTLLLDTLKCLPSTFWYYFLFSIPSVILLLVFLFSPFGAILLVAFEFLLEKYGLLPRSNFLRKLKTNLHFTSFKYKSVKILQEAPVETFPRTNFLVAPHGVSEDHLVPIEKLLLSKKINYQVTCNEMLFKLPFSKTFYSLLGGIPAKKESYFKAEKENQSLFITLGDGYELFYLDEPSTIALKDNKVFFKYALETGTSLTPIYVFNYNKTFKFFRHFQQERISIFEKNKSAIIQPFYGRCFLPIPYRVELNVVIGTPLAVQKIENPSWQEVENLFNRYIFHIKELYRKHTGDNDPPLKIV